MAERGSSHQGSVKDPEHDGRLKENREAGRTKETTPGSQARAHGKDPEGGKSSGEHGGSHASKGSEQHSGGKQGASGESRGGESDDLKSREYKDAQGNVHHHTRTYQEQHGKE